MTLITANLEIDAPTSVEVVRVGSTLELADAVNAAASDADVIVMAAAVADYRPDSVADDKIKKEAQGDILELRLVKNPDILQGLSQHRTPGQVIVGFAAETEADDAKLLDLGRAKVARKGADLLVVNRVGWTEGFATDTNTVVIVNRAGAIVGGASGSKASVAESILDVISNSSKVPGAIE